MSIFNNKNKNVKNKASILKTVLYCTLFLASSQETLIAQVKAHNPTVFADVPDSSVIRVGDTYYMSSTTMHMSPGVPIMKSKDLVNWVTIGYAYDKIGEDNDAMNLNNGKNTYSNGSWASSLRFHNGIYYISTFSQTTDKTYIFTTKDIEKGPWKKIEIEPKMHDHSLFFDDDGKIYMVYDGGTIKRVEIKQDLSGIVEGTGTILIQNASAPSGPNVGLPAEGSQLFKVNGKYYLFNITWPKDGMRTVVVHRANSISGPWEGKVVLQDLGVAQGGLVDTPNGEWYSYLFRDYGAVGRIPYLVPVQWENGWPVLGVNGKVPTELDLPANQSLIPGIVNSDEFTRNNNERKLPLVWQWNHNPDDRLWSVTQRKGFLRLTTGRVDADLLQAKNTLTQRAIGPVSTGITDLEIDHMKDGDFAGLTLFQKDYGQLGIRIEGKQSYLVFLNGSDGNIVEEAKILITQKKIALKAEADFRDLKDTAQFSYSLDGKTWVKIGNILKMKYTLPHFMGYRFGLFNYATKTKGGYADFDYFRITDTISEK